MVFLTLVIFGLISYSRLGIEENPDVDFPFMSISTVYPGADPETVETEVTKRIEDEVATLSGIKSLTSTSADSVSLVFIEFELDVDLDVASQDVRDKMEGIRRSLPDSAETPIVQKFDVMGQSVLDIAVGGDVRPQDIARYVEDVLRPRIETIEGVGSVEITGLREREIRIWLDPDRMASYEIGPGEVIGKIQSENVDFPGGRIETGDREYIVVTSGQLESVEEFENLVIAVRRGTQIRLSDIAEVEDGLEDLRSMARLNGVPAVGMGVVKKSGENTIAIADSVIEVVDSLKAEAPPGLEISIPWDNSVFIRDSFEEVQGHLFGGGIMAIIIVLMFLGSFRTTIIAAVAIPTSIITTYIFMNLFDFTLNNVTMLAFTLMVGMLIDDAIVVIENIYRHTEMGKGPIQAAKDGAKEIAFAVLSTTLTILAVFIPVAFMSGIIGRFMYQYGITVAVGSVASYFVAITLGPMLSSRFLKKEKENFFLFNWFNKGFKRLENGYRWLIGAALRRKGLTILIAILSMIGAIFLLAQTKQEFFSPLDYSVTQVSIEMPLGTSLPNIMEFSRDIEERIEDIPEIENLYTTLGGGFLGDQNEGTIFVDLTDKTERDRSVWDIEDEIRERITGIPGAKLIVGTSMGFGSNYDFPLQLTGADLDELLAVADQIREAMEESEIFRETDISYKEGKPEVHINIDRERAADRGINIMNIGSTVRMLVSGEDSVSTFMEGGEQYEVKMRLAEEFRDRPEDIGSLVVYDRDDSPVELSSFADIEITTGAAEIEHADKMRAILVYGNLNDGFTTGDATNWANEIMDTMLPPGYDGRLVGEAEIMIESFQSMGFALILAVFLIFMILAAQFNHFVYPLSIMVTLPLSFVGAFGLLYATGMTVNMFSYIGIIMLMGLVTKNAILVVEFTNQLRERGMDREEALLTAGPIRLRPVLMTALSTIGGMLPVALMLGGGAGVELRAPMAVAVIGGLAASTLLSLVVVPVVYSLFDTFTNFIFRIFKVKTGEDEVEIQLPDDQI